MNYVGMMVLINGYRQRYRDLWDPVKPIWQAGGYVHPSLMDAIRDAGNDWIDAIRSYHLDPLSNCDWL